LPTSPTRGDTVILVDYAGTFATNNVIVNTGTTNLDSTTTREYKLTTNDTIAEFVYVDSTKGWITRINTTTGATPSGVFNEFGGYDTQGPFIAATGGTVTTSGDYKIHTFTGDGCFVVTNQGTPLGSTQVDYLVVAGGGGGSAGPSGGGAGGGGFRESHSVPVSGCYSASPLATPTGITLSATTYPVTVGGGGTAGAPGPANDGGRGSNSIFSTITSTGGGGGSVNGCSVNPATVPGGSGGGARYYQGVGGTGNTPPVSPPQGNPGGAGSACGVVGNYPAGGGGGATEAGVCGPNTGPNPSGRGGAGATTSISTSPTSYSGGGGGGYYAPVNAPGPGSPCGTGTPGAGSQNASANTGGGAGSSGPGGTGGSGGKGIVIIRYKFQ